MPITLLTNAKFSPKMYRIEEIKTVNVFGLVFFFWNLLCPLSLTFKWQIPFYPKGGFNWKKRIPYSEQEIFSIHETKFEIELK